MVLCAVSSIAQGSVSCHLAAHQILVCQSDTHSFSSLVSFTCLPFLVSFTFQLTSVFASNSELQQTTHHGAVGPAVA